MTAQLRRVHELIGQLTSKVSEIDTLWYLIFTCLMHQTPRAIADAIVNVHRTGEGQRQPILAVAAVVFPRGSAAIKFLGQLKQRTDEIASRRAAAVHSVISIQGVPGQRVHARGITKPSKLAGKDIEADLVACIADSDTVIDAAGSFLSALSSFEQPSPALKSPQLKDGWKNPLEDKSREPSQQTRPPPRSSPA